MKKILCIILISCLFPAYSVGDIVSSSHQNQEFEVCYPSAMDNTITLGDYNGNTNGGDYNILVIDASATWCGPCQSLIPLFDELQENYDDNDYVEFFVALSDLNQPYSCSQWGNMGTSGIPLIIDDTGYPLFNMFNTGSSFPSLALVDHNMKVYYKEAGYSNTFVQNISEIIDEMLYNMENSLILYNEVFFTIDESSDDGDGILNPNEEFTLDFIINNNSFYLDALNVSAQIETENELFENYNDISFDSDQFDFGDIILNGSSAFSVNGMVAEDVFLGTHNFQLVVSAEYVDLNGNYSETSFSYPFSLDIVLNQLGFPYDTNSEIKASPASVDFTNDGYKEIIFGDNSGLIHVLDANGNSVLTDIFPYDTGNQIWGSPAAGFIDDDELIDIAITSKSKHLYIFDKNGIKLDFNANQYLMGTPALGNLDDDEDLEIVFGGFSSGAKLFAINIDGTPVDGFPFEIDEKMQKGVALADFNNNGKDDIVVGTDDDFIHLIYDDGTIGFSYQTGDKIRSAPIIIDNGNDKIVVVGSKDDNLYAVNSSGELHFQFDSGGDIYTSPSLLETNEGNMIFFGNNQGQIYALDINGNLKDGFPIELMEQGILMTFSAISGSVVFEDLNSDGLAEIIFGDEGGELHILSTLDPTYSTFSYYNNMPVSNTFSYSSSLSVQDIDNDGDVEIFGGTTGDLIIIDVKENSPDTSEYWSIFRNNYHRNGLISIESQCMQGDITNDGVIDILDIVTLVNAILGPVELTDLESCAADMNGDSIIDILDIVMLVNYILN